MRLTLDEKAKPDFVKIADASGIVKFGDSGEYEVLVSGKAPKGATVTANFELPDGNKLYLGQFVVPTSSDEFTIKSSEVNTKYFYTKTAPRQISGKIIVTTDTGLKAEKPIVFTVDKDKYSNSKTGGWTDRGGAKSSGTTYTEPELVKDLRLEKTEEKQAGGSTIYTVKLNGNTEVKDLRSIKVKYNYNSNPSPSSDIETSVQIGSDQSFSEEVGKVIVPKTETSCVVFKISKLIFTDPTGKLEPKEIKGNELPEIQLQCAQSIPAPAAVEYADVPPNTKFKDIKKADVDAGKYKVVMPDGNLYQLSEIRSLPDRIILDLSDSRVITSAGKPELTVKGAINEGKIKGLKVKK